MSISTVKWCTLIISERSALRYQISCRRISRAMEMDHFVHFATYIRRYTATWDVEVTKPIFWPVLFHGTSFRGNEDFTNGYQYDSIQYQLQFDVCYLTYCSVYRDAGCMYL